VHGPPNEHWLCPITWWRHFWSVTSSNTTNRHSVLTFLTKTAQALKRFKIWQKVPITSAKKIEVKQLIGYYFSVLGPPDNFAVTCWLNANKSNRWQLQPKLSMAHQQQNGHARSIDEVIFGLWYYQTSHIAIPPLDLSWKTAISSKWSCILQKCQVTNVEKSWSPNWWRHFLPAVPHGS
jgi:hypothetical protein